MINVDISNVWGQVSLPDLLALEQEIFNAHQTLTEGTGEGNDFLGWLDLPTETETDEIRRIRAAAKQIRETSDVFVVIGIGGSYLGPRAAIELMQGANHNIGKGKGNPQIFYAGNTLSTRHWNELLIDYHNDDCNDDDRVDDREYNAQYTCHLPLRFDYFALGCDTHFVPRSR